MPRQPHSTLRLDFKCAAGSTVFCHLDRFGIGTHTGSASGARPHCLKPRIFLARWPSKAMCAFDQHEHVSNASPGHIYCHRSAKQVQHVVDGSGRHGHRIAERTLARDDHQAAFLVAYLDELAWFAPWRPKRTKGIKPIKVAMTAGISSGMSWSTSLRSQA